LKLSVKKKLRQNVRYVCIGINIEKEEIIKGKASRVFETSEA